MKSLLIKTLLVISVVTLTTMLAFAADDWATDVDHSDGKDPNVALSAQGAGALCPYADGRCFKNSPGHRISTNTLPGSAGAAGASGAADGSSPGTDGHK